MDKKITMYNVRDTRTGKIHSVAVVSEKNAQYFVPVAEEQEEGGE